MERLNNIFISWSGERSKSVATALRGWLPLVIHGATPWLSESDIGKGTRGLAEISRALSDIKVGIVCLTSENLSSRWILYEAGALSKSIDEKTRLCTYLLDDLRPENIEPPLGMFQHTRANKEETLALVNTINSAIAELPIANEVINPLFDALWPQLERALQAPSPAKLAPKGRTVEEMVAELLDLTRSEVSGRRDAERSALAAARSELVEATKLKAHAQRMVEEAQMSKTAPRVYQIKFRDNETPHLLLADYCIEGMDGSCRFKIGNDKEYTVEGIESVVRVRPASARGISAMIKEQFTNKEQL